jgi:hypothetical protein
MDIAEEASQELIAKLKTELRRRAENRGWALPPYWADDVLNALQDVFDQEGIEVARRWAPGLANPVLTMRLTKP